MEKITLKVLRAMYDYNQTQMATRLGITRQYYNQIEKKRIKISASVLAKICEEFGVKPSDLIV